MWKKENNFATSSIFEYLTCKSSHLVQREISTLIVNNEQSVKVTFSQNEERRLKCIIKEISQLREKKGFIIIHFRNNFAWQSKKNCKH